MCVVVVGGGSVGVGVCIRVGGVVVVGDIGVGVGVANVCVVVCVGYVIAIAIVVVVDIVEYIDNDCVVGGVGI